MSDQSARSAIACNKCGGLGYIQATDGLGGTHRYACECTPSQSERGDGEDITLFCPLGVESETGHFDPAGYDKNDCAGCGEAKSKHYRGAVNTDTDGDLLRELASRFAPGCIRPQDTLQMEPFTHTELSAIQGALLAAAARSSTRRIADYCEPTNPETPGDWEERCSALYQVIGCLADMAGIFTTSDDVANALDVAAGRGDVEKLLPWPKDVEMYARVLKHNQSAASAIEAKLLPEAYGLITKAMHTMTCPFTKCEECVPRHELRKQMEAWLDKGIPNPTDSARRTDG